MTSNFTKTFKQLNTYQLEAVQDDSPVCVVNANVGSGKTTVLIEKILYLHFQKQVPLEDMIVLTFTNKAANEILERLYHKEPSIQKEQIRGFGTFHSVALYLLKNRLPIEKAGWNREFTVIDPDEEADLALELIASHQLNVKYKNRLKKRLEQEQEGYRQGKESSRYRDDLFRLFSLLEEEKKRQNKMTFSDLIQVSTALLKGGTFHPSWIIVDEVQDSDGLQIEFLAALKGENTRLFAVGDPNQVIYSWRGTSLSNFYYLKHRFKARELSLPVNYRSNAAILEMANHFMQYGNKIQGVREPGNKILVKNHYDPFAEAEYLAQRIQELHGSGLPYKEIAIFYRLQKQSDIIEKVFTKHEIPCEVSVRKTIKDIPVLDWLVKVLRFSCNPKDQAMGIQVLSDGRYGEKCSKKKAAEILKNHKTEAFLLYRRMMDFLEQEKWKSESLPTKEELFVYFGLREALHPTSADYTQDEKLVLAFLDRLCAFCKNEHASLFQGVREFVNSSALYGVSFFEETEGEEADTVKLMTLHASKGLEFDTVFLIGCNQGLIPLHSQNFDQEEEERRLFFVGVTRAKNTLELSYYTNPGDPRILGVCSPYLKRIPPQLLDWEAERTEADRRQNLQDLRKKVQEKMQKEAVQPAVRRAKHPKYGTGILVSEDESIVEVEFDGYGRKKFMKAFGEVEIL
jgi:DNA helicase-2/ATP-dependent DNA helicase PcrA